MPPKTNIKLMPAVEYARAHTEDAIAVLADLMFSADKDSTRVAAAVAMLNRGWGTPPQSLVVQGGEVPKNFNFDALTADQLRELHRLQTLIRQDDEVVKESDMPDESTLKNVTSLAVVPPQNPPSQEQPT